MPQPTLLNFFSRTPKSSNNSPAAVRPKKESESTRDSREPEPSSSKTSNGGSPRKSSSPGESSAGATTPVSSRNGAGQKRRRTSGQTPDSSNLSARKKLRNDDSPPVEDFTEGTLVWGLIEGYPWWPAMIRSETRGQPCSRKRSLLEFHVQFFDEPPSRAWIRKGDLKPYVGSHDANIPPNRSDRKWVTACKAADEALSLGRNERIKKYWVDFPSGDEVEENVEEPLEEEDDEDKMDVSSALEEKETPKSRQREVKKHRRLRAISSSSDEEDAVNGSSSSTKKKSRKLDKKKRHRDSDVEEYSPTKNGTVEEESECSESPVVSEEMSEAEEDDQSDNEGKGKRKVNKSSRKSKPDAKRTPATPKTSSGQADLRNRLQQFNVDAQSASPGPKPSTSNSNSNLEEKDDQIWDHMKLDFAMEGKRKDANKRKESDPDYDPRTLYVPDDFMKKLTPAMRQWWEVKRKNFDTILFFKVGKFYEFYHWDACVAAKELGISYMRGTYAHSGFPEIAFSRFANALVEKGYKIARIEQTETPDMLNERIKKSKLDRQEKVIRREVCQISTKGVRYASFQDVTASNPFNPESAYLYAIVEKQPTSSNEGPSFGVCFVDTTIGTFYVGQFCDDRHASRLRTLFSHYVPAQILYEKGKLSSNLQQLLFNLSGVRKDALTPDTEFWGAKKVLKFLAEQDYFRASDSDSGSPNWPSALQNILSKSDGLGLTPDESWELGVKCLGGIVAYLKYCLLDHDLLSLKRFELYKPVDQTEDHSSTSRDLPERCFKPKYMVLDGITIRNLEILDGPLSLLSVIDKCGTNFGKRLLRHWLCLPLALPEEIKSRQDAIEELMQQRESREKIIPMLKSLPDLERLLSKIHYLGSAHRSKNHPDGRAFFFEDIKYSKNKIADLLSVLRGFKACVNIIKELKRVKDELSSKLICNLVDTFPQLDDLLVAFDNAFDHQLAAKEGKIKPKKGAVEEYDMALQAVLDIQSEAEDYLRQLAKELRTRATYFGSDKKRFQIEVPDSIKMSREFEMSSSRKGFKRYHNSMTKEFLASIMRAEAERDEVLRDIARKIFEKFDTHRETWSKAVECIANLDVLISLSLFSESQEVMCRPELSFSDKPFISIVEGRHPCVASDSYIPNNTTLGLETDGVPKGNFVILTGPNMGGKSTLMRQIGLLSVLSHLGCFVPAEKCELSIVDRIFTRLGANDNIGEGESTFYVEMSETSAILRHASSDSLLLIDELGRGTATYDGTAIAYATAKELSERNCRALFSTHYHTLVEALQDIPSIQMSHMACMVENENEEDPTQESITFLYKMISGPCPKSYGFNAARLAGINDEVIRVAHKKAKELESIVAGVRCFTSICSRIRNKELSLAEFAALKI